MTLALRKPITLADFLLWEERQPLRYEVDGVDPAPMTSGTRAHADIQANLTTALRTRRAGSMGATSRFGRGAITFAILTAS
jgi:hypothetical protein